MIESMTAGLRYAQGEGHLFSKSAGADAAMATVVFAGEDRADFPLWQSGLMAPVNLRSFPVGPSPNRSWEQWQTASAPETGLHGLVRYACADSLLFGVIEIDERSVFWQPGILPPLQHAAALAYRSAFAAMDQLGFRHVLRFWNYIPEINGESHGMERYRQFNAGRQEGFLQSGRSVLESVPAASAVGSQSGPLTVHFLAARDTVAHPVENPRQVSAYRYPSQYGPKSPTFSRAALVDMAEQRLLLLSGTASIVGHATFHVNDVVAQTRETLANIGAVLSEVQRIHAGARFAFGDLDYRVYVRHEDDLPAIESVVRQTIGNTASAIFVQADICRRDLLLEIEATASQPGAPSTSA